MAIIVPLDFKAGINRENTQYTTGGYWYDGNKVRFRSGKPENIRGWAKKLPTLYSGVARDLTSWSSLSGNLYAAFGTDQLLYIYGGGTLYDITPVNVCVQTSSQAPIFYSSTGSTKLVVDWVSQSPDLVAIGLTQNTFVIVSAGSQSVGGIPISGKFRTSIPVNLSTNRYFKLITSTTATGNASSSISSSFTFLLNAGSQTQVEDLGYGTYLWNEPRSSLGAGTGWGTPASVGQGFAVLPRNWSLSQWGEDLIACPRGGQIYVWSENGGTGQRATVITSCPSQNTIALVSPLDRHMIALGTLTTTSVFDPLLVRWSDAENYNQWITSITNTAGEQRLGDGSKIIGAINSKNQILVWTDNSLYSMAFVGVPFIFQFQQIGTNCGLVGMHSAVEADGRAFWMSNKDFYYYEGGAVKTLPCTVNAYIFENLNSSYTDKVFCGFNTEFTEITWLYPSSNSTECDSYVIYSPLENWWSYGTAKWTTWEDKKLYGNVLTTGSDSYLYDNEPKNVYTGDGQNLSSYIQSGDFDLDKQASGNNIVFINRVIPDFDLPLGGDVTFTLSFKKYPQSSSSTAKGPYTVTNTTEKISLRGRGRQVNLKVQHGSQANTQWRFGSMTADMTADGER